MLGIAFQRGELPLSLDSLEYGIQETMGSAATENWLAFKLGRKIAQEVRGAAVPAGDGTYHEMVAEKSERLKRSGRRGKKLAQEYWRLVTGARAKLTLDARHESLLAHRIYDLIRYENLAYAEDYVARLLRLHAKDSAAQGYAATQAALWNLHRVMAIKDEVYVAALLTSEEKYESDRERYNVRPELGDRMIHRHLNRPEFTLGGTRLRFRIRTRPWMLKLMRRGKFLRRMLPAWHAKGKGVSRLVFPNRGPVRRAVGRRVLRDVAENPAPARGSDRLPRSALPAHGRRPPARRGHARVAARRRRGEPQPVAAALRPSAEIPTKWRNLWKDNSSGNGGSPLAPRAGTVAQGRPPNAPPPKSAYAGCYDGPLIPVRECLPEAARLRYRGRVPRRSSSRALNPSLLESQTAPFRA